METPKEVQPELAAQVDWAKLPEEQKSRELDLHSGTVGRLDQSMDSLDQGQAETQSEKSSSNWQRHNGQGNPEIDHREHCENKRCIHLRLQVKAGEIANEPAWICEPQRKGKKKTSGTGREVFRGVIFMLRTTSIDFAMPQVKAVVD